MGKERGITNPTSLQLQKECNDHHHKASSHHSFFKNNKCQRDGLKLARGK